MKQGIQKLTDLALDAICPPECALCETAMEQSGKFCGECRASIVSDYVRCRKCAAPLPAVVDNSDCTRCRNARFRFSSVVTLGPYENQLCDIVVAMKRTNQYQLRSAIANLMAQQLTSSALPFDGQQSNGEGISDAVIVPVPNHWSQGLFGHADSAGGLAKRIGAVTGIPVRTDLVRKVRKTSKQGTLAWSERRQNVRGAYEIGASEPLSGLHVILVDDVLTTGATCGEIAKVLSKAGIESVTVLVAARGMGAQETVTVSASVGSPRQPKLTGDNHTDRQGKVAVIE